MSMWNRKDAEPSAPGTEARRPLPSAASYEDSPATQFAPRGASHRVEEVASIGQSMLIKGEIRSREDLFLDGDMEGKLDIDQHRLTIGPNGKVRATIRAREVEIQGAVQGNIEATERIIIRKNAKLVGDLKMAGIVIEDGAYFKGSIDITQTQTAPPQPAPAQAAQPQEAKRPASAAPRPQPQPPASSAASND